jgi:Raf kinase inhibitor-like YbhB/YbcL family protein
MKKHLILGISVLVLVIFISGCTSQNDSQTTGNSSNFKIKSSAFSDGGKIPQKYTSDGENISPPLSWTSTPAGTKTFAIICEDPDAPGGNFTHWVVFNIPKNVNQLAEGITNQRTLDNGAKQGINDFNRIGYSGPAPPSGTHRYVFKIYALDTELNLGVGATKDQLTSAMQGHIIGEAQITGKYSA